jgi:hypothetical protein
MRKNMGLIAGVFYICVSGLSAQEDSSVSDSELTTIINNIIRATQPEREANARSRGDVARALTTTGVNVLIDMAPTPGIRFGDRSINIPIVDGLRDLSNNAIGDFIDNRVTAAALENLTEAQRRQLERDREDLRKTIEENRELRYNEQRQREFDERIRRYREEFIGPPRPNEFMRRHENQMHAAFGDYTTGISSPIGSAREQRSPDPELARLLASDPRSPFVATVESPSGLSTGGFTGEEGLNIAGVLNVLAFDSGNLQDGDRVRLTVRDSRGVVLSREITLTFGGSTSRVSAQRGLVNVTITALNEGTAPPNTGGLRVSGDVAGNRNANFNLSLGQSGTLAVRVLGN